VSKEEKRIWQAAYLSALASPAWANPRLSFGDAPTGALSGSCKQIADDAVRAWRKREVTP
jgi:hypothetical protein